MSDGDQEQGGEDEVIMKQKLMSAEEVYVYKIPPLKGAGGHRAEDWNLAKPIQTCSILVERRGDILFIEFKNKENGNLFAASQVDMSVNGPKHPLQYWLEQVMDSSRYFTIKIQNEAGRQATIGFGFRERDEAIDFRESVQHYENAMKREKESPKLATYSVPKLEEGEKIHVKVAGKKDKKKPKKSPDKKGGTGGAPLLLKKPPPSPETAKKLAAESAAEEIKAAEKLSITMGDINLDEDIKQAHTHDNEDDGSSSGGAVYTGDEEQWAHEFDTK